MDPEKQSPVAPSHPNYDHDEPPRPQGYELALVFLGFVRFLLSQDGAGFHVLTRYAPVQSQPGVVPRGARWHHHRDVASYGRLRVSRVRTCCVGNQWVRFFWFVFYFSTSRDRLFPWSLILHVLTKHFSLFANSFRVEPLLSKLSDTFGRKPIVLFSISLFLIGSVLCGASVSMLMLIISRAIAGIGGAGVFAMHHQRCLCHSFCLWTVDWRLVHGLFVVAMELLYQIEFSNSPFARFSSLPFGGAAFLILFFFLRLPYPKTSFMEKLKNIDYLGTFLVIAFATLFLLGLNFGGQTYPWTSAPVISCLVLSVFLLAPLIWCEIYHAVDPIIPPHLFRIRTVTAVLTLNWFFGLNLFTLVGVRCFLVDRSLVLGAACFRDANEC
ncbi:hypothetical protein BC936DRAFT_137967 [Jimgerdemannia flammicorona]|uniref:Major facilitator superfamily domain-containing protein n=1 Tax=Jimgerdemannia flammicorona TaxID=994334 RepID=A0A433CWB5_9FUNG|nr:hypothetical protein BC936DRAFT_137967 [Jimgerdemannia flammicorona]